MKTRIMFVAACVCGLAFGGMSLDGAWSLSYRLQQEGGEWKTISATVPGDALIDLERAGVIPDPMVGTNAWGLFRYEQMEWKYARNFPAPALKPGETARLRFEGVDTRAAYFLNGERIGASENMFVPQTFDVTGRLAPTNRLEVLIRSPLGLPLLGVLGRSRVGGTDVETVRKAQHSFGWDIMPRLVSPGIWRSVTLDVLPPERFGDVHWFVMNVNANARTALVRVDCQILAPWRHLHASTLRLTLSRNGKVAARTEHVVRFFQTRDNMYVRNAALWWPRGTGREPSLYDATAELLDGEGRVLARDERKIGLRTVRLERADWYSPENPGTFRFLINGEPTFVKGTDWSPMDALHSRDAQHLPKCLAMVEDLNCNMIRVWGGGVYEPDAFFDFCDEKGVMVWQDFMMGNVSPPQDEDFARVIYDEAKQVVVRFRSHPSIVLWNANNEIDRSTASVMGPYAPDPNLERISRDILPRVLRDFDPMRPYIPSSPYWTPDVVAGKAKLSQEHLWGPRERWFKDAYWTNAPTTFVSEMGCHGCPSLESLKKMMTKEGVYPWPDPSDPFHFNDEWCCKSTQAYPDYPRGMGHGRNSLMPRQVKTMFGSVPRDVAAFVDQSQIYQAEAVKYWIEMFRSRKGRTWGIMWWNLRDGWPIISDGIVDYYYNRKRAYDAIKSVQGDQLVLLDDAHRLIAVNDTLAPVSGKVKAVDVASGKTLFDGACNIPANGKMTVTDALPLSGQGMLKIVYTFGGVERVNRALYGEPPFRYSDYLEWQRK